MNLPRVSISALLIAALAFGASACSSSDDNNGGTRRLPGGTDPLPTLSAEVALPIVFVHGFAGSAQQYQSQAMRFEANGYPSGHIRVFEHDGAGFTPEAINSYAAGADEAIDAARRDFKVDQVYLVGHSRGTIVSSQYLGDPAHAAKIAKYISLDGAGCGAANAANVPCLALTQKDFDGQKHVEVSTSRESFAKQYEFLLGTPPKVVDIVPQAEPVHISGRAVNFPANTGRDGAILDIWEINFQTGARVGSKPLATFHLGADGSFGPVVVDATKHYEMALLGPEAGNITSHFYMQPLLRNSPFVRLLSGPPTDPIRANASVGDGQAMLIALRMREWLPSDVLTIATTSPSGNQPPVNVISDKFQISSAAFPPIAIHLQDAAASPGDTTLDPLPYYPAQPFQTGVDVFMPAADPPNGTITAINLPRGDTSKPQTLRFPNWSSTHHLIMAMFSDFAQD